MTLGDGLADDLFRTAESIDRGGIDEIDAALDRCSDRGNGFRFLGSTPHPAADGPGAQATRDTSSDVPAMAARSISISPVSVSRAMVLLLLLRGLRRRFFSARSRASHQPRRIDAAHARVAGLSSDILR